MMLCQMTSHPDVKEISLDRSIQTNLFYALL